MSATLVGTSLVLLDMRAVSVLPANGAEVTMRTRLYPRIMGSDESGFWLASGAKIRRIGPTGTPASRWFALPNGDWWPETASRDSVVLVRYRNGSAIPELAQWWPRTGRLVALANSCPYENVSAGADAVVVFGCRGGTAVTVYDGHSGRTLTTVESLPFRGGRSVSPDGRTLAIGRNGGPNAVALLDLDSGRLRKVRVPEPVSAAAWSPDSRWLLLVRNAFVNFSGVDNLALLDTQTDQIVALRLPFNLNSDSVVGLR